MFRPLGIYLGLRASRRRKAPTNDVLEQAYMSSKTKVCLPYIKSAMYLFVKKNFFFQVFSQESLLELSSKLGMTVRQAERWLRIRRLQNKPSTLEKFSETG